MIHDFEPTAFHLSIGSHEPVLRVASGDTIRTWCVDSGGFDRNQEDLTDGGNPMTGPFFVDRRCGRARPRHGHALQGDGEIVGTGIEVSMDVELTLEVVKGKRIRWPRADDGTFVMAVGNARPLDQAVQHATTELVTLLKEDYGLDYPAGSSLLGQCIRYDVGNVFDPAYTIVAKVEKALLERL